MIKPDELTGSGVDEDTVRRIIVVARSIAPCIDSFPDDSEEKKDALAVLRGVVREVVKRGSRSIQSQGVSSARVTYFAVRSAFSQDDRDALVALCGAGSLRAGGPVGSFPKARPVSRVWPEGPYS